jgi:hypothetical protein
MMAYALLPLWIFHHGVLGVPTPNVKNSMVRLRRENLLPFGRQSQHPFATRNPEYLTKLSIVAETFDAVEKVLDGTGFDAS